MKALIQVSFTVEYDNYQLAQYISDAETMARERLAPALEETVAGFEWYGIGFQPLRSPDSLRSDRL